MASACGHCGAAAPADGRFCTACGYALPGSAMRAVRVFGEREYASSEFGLTFQARELGRDARRAVRVLGVLAALQFLVAGGLLAMSFAAAEQAPPEHREAWVGFILLLSVAVAVMGVVYGALALAAWWWPAPAAIAGAVIVGTAGLATLAGGPVPAVTNGVVSVIVVVLLARAARAGMMRERVAARLPARAGA